MVLNITSGNQVISLYPNPAKDYVTVTLPSMKPAILEIVNNNGNIVLKKNISALSAIVDLGKVTPGVYTVRITQDQNTSTQKLLKQ
jgi:hypothetical protein